MNPFLKEDCLHDFSKTEALINDNQLLKINPSALKANMAEEHKKEMKKQKEESKNETSSNFD